MSSPESSLTRRELLKKAGKIAIAGAAGLIVGNEINKGKDGIVRVDEGNFIPLYERHSLGISPENFPQDIDALFRESGERLITIQVYLKYFPQTVRSLLNQGSRTNANEIISNLSKRNAPLVFGDISFPDLKYSELGLSAEIITGFAATGAFFALKDTPQNTTRRRMLKLALGSVSFFGLSEITTFIPLLTSYIENPEWITRVNRIEGIISHIHPEQPLTFLRNSIMANKLLLTGKYLKEKLGRQPDIAFWVGSGHSGIEDFLQAGLEVCREIIALYPKSYLQHIINYNGGSEDFSSALLAYPKATGENQYAFDLVKITDQKLMAGL